MKEPQEGRNTPASTSSDTQQKRRGDSQDNNQISTFIRKSSAYCRPSSSLLCACAFASGSSWFAWREYQGKGLCVAGSTNSIISICATIYLNKRNRHFQASVAGALTEIFVPMAVYGFQHSMGYYMDIAPTPSLDPKRKQVTQSPLLWRLQYVPMELSALATGYFLLKHFKYPLLALPMAASALSLGLTAGGISTKTLFSYGIISIILTRYVEKYGICALWRGPQTPADTPGEKKRRADYLYWQYVVSVSALCVGLGKAWLSWEHTELLALCHGVMAMLGLLWSRRVFLLTGTPGLLFYLHYIIHRGTFPQACASGVLHLIVTLAGTALRNRTAAMVGAVGVLMVLVRVAQSVFPRKSENLFLTTLGLGIVVAGMQYEKYEDIIVSEAQRPLLRLWQQIKGWSEKYI